MNEAAPHFSAEGINPHEAYDAADSRIQELSGQIDALNEQLAGLDTWDDQYDSLEKQREMLQAQLQSAQEELTRMSEQIDAQIDEAPQSKYAGSPHFTAEDFRQNTAGRTSGPLFSDREAPQGDESAAA